MSGCVNKQDIPYAAIPGASVGLLQVITNQDGVMLSPYLLNLMAFPWRHPLPMSDARQRLEMEEVKPQ